MCLKILKEGIAPPQTLPSGERDTPWTYQSAVVDAARSDDTKTSFMHCDAVVVVVTDYHCESSTASSNERRNTPSTRPSLNSSASQLLSSQRSAWACSGRRLASYKPTQPGHPSVVVVVTDSHGHADPTWRRARAPARTISHAPVYFIHRRLWQQGGRQVAAHLNCTDTQVDTTRKSFSFRN